MASTDSRIRLLHDRLVKREQSSVELTRQYLQEIERADDSIRAYVKVTPEEALAAAEAVDKKIMAGEDPSLLAGIPMSLKDNMSTNGIETTCCSKILQGYVPIYDATVWKLLKSQGAVMLGKSNMDEFAMGSSCETSCFGGSRNPYDLGRVAGGSSGGAAASVGAGLAVYGLGSDTGGSIRQPASFCGLVGLKPTYGAVSRYGLVAFASSFDQIGPITETVEDAALVFDAISAYDPMDSTSQGRQGAPTAEGIRGDIRGLRIGIAPEYFEGVREDIRAALDKAIETYRELGAEIVEVSLPEIKYALPVYYILACAEASSNLGRYDGIRYGYRSEHYEDINDMICKTRSEGFGAEVQRRILLGTYVLSAGYFDAYYKKAQNLRGAIVCAFDRCFEKCDVLLTPTVPMTAFPVGFTGQSTVDTYLTDICTVPVNIAGLPAVSVPCGKDDKGLPIGMQLIGKRFAESEILRAAWQYEQQTAGQFVRQSEWGVRL